MMEGNDLEKRLKLQAQQNNVYRSNTQKYEDANSLKQEYERKIKITKKHYRKFYRDELENIPSLFPKPVFTTLDIVRGATRGVRTSFFSHKKKDASGEFSNQKIVGKFKGLIEVWNSEERKAMRQKKT